MTTALQLRQEGFARIDIKNSNAAAKARAKALRNQGFNARVIPDGKKFAVWARPKKRAKLSRAKQEAMRRAVIRTGKKTAKKLAGPRRKKGLFVTAKGSKVAWGKARAMVAENLTVVDVKLVEKNVRNGMSRYRVTVRARRRPE